MCTVPIALIAGPLVNNERITCFENPICNVPILDQVLLLYISVPYLTKMSTLIKQLYLLVISYC